jgi:hypothetical protein
MRQLLAFVAYLCVFFALIAAVSGVAATVIFILASVVFLHVFATILGGRLRERADRTRRFSAFRRPSLGSFDGIAEHDHRFTTVTAAPRSPWHARGTTVLPWLRRTVIVAIAVGGVIGATYLALAIGDRISVAGVVVGSLSVAVLFGWFAFLFGSFYGVFRHGFREAVSEQQKDMQVRQR